MLKIDGALARNIDFEVADFEIHEENSWEKGLVRNTVVVLSFSACLALILWFRCGSVPVGKAANHLSSEGFRRGDNAIFRDRHSVFIFIGTAAPRAMLPSYFMPFCVARALLGDVTSTVHTSTITLSMSRSTPHSTNQALHFTLYTVHSAHYTFAIYTLHFTLYTPHSRFTLRTPQSPLHSLLTTFPLYYLLNTSLFLVYSSHSTLCTPPHSTLHSVHWYGNREGMYNTFEFSCFAMFRKSILRDCIRVGWLVLFRMRPKDFGNLFEILALRIHHLGININKKDRQ